MLLFFKANNNNSEILHLVWERFPTYSATVSLHRSHGVGAFSYKYHSFSIGGGNIFANAKVLTQFVDVFNYSFNLYAFNFIVGQTVFQG